MEFVDGKKGVNRLQPAPAAPLTNGQTYTLKCVISGNPGSRTLKFYVDGQESINTTAIDDTWSGGAVGLYRGSGGDTAALQWDNFKCGIDNNSDGDIDDSGDYIYANYDFNDNGGVTWQTLTLAHDDNGNLIDDGLFKYSYDAWNRLAGTWYHDAHVDGNGHPDVTGERVATYAYDGLFRRTGKVVANQGEGVVFHSDDNGTGIKARATLDMPPRARPACRAAAVALRATRPVKGARTEHYFYSGWRLVVTTDHASGDPYVYANSHVLGQFVYGTQYIDEPVCYDRNTDVGSDSGEAAAPTLGG